MYELSALNTWPDVKVGLIVCSTQLDSMELLNCQKTQRHNCQKIATSRLSGQSPSIITLIVNRLGEIDA
jgi:hypothetical protein